MSDADKYMDDSFRKMSEEFKVSYDKSFWEEAKAKLENDSLDSAFRDAAAQFSAASIGGMELASESLSDAFMDEAFKEAANKMSVTYDAAYWSQMEASQPDLQMDEAFHTASKELKASYNPAFWGDADIALQQEGLHYEYDSAYWNEAKELLDKADRKSFFRRWAGVAVLLLLISFAGVNSEFILNYADTFKGGKATNDGVENGLVTVDNHSRNLTENTDDRLVEADVDMNEEAALNVVEENNNMADQANNEADNLVVEENESGTENNAVQENLENENANPLVVENDGDEGVENANEENIASDDVNREIRNEDRSNDNDSNEEIGVTEEIRNNFSPVNIDQRPEDLEFTNDNETNNEVDLAVEDLNPLFLTPINRTLSPVSLNRSNLEIPNNSLMDVKSLRPIPVHTIAVFGGIGRGNSYGFENLVAASRYAGGLEYTFDGFGKRSRLELGASVSINYSSHENLRHTKKEVFYLDNGDVEHYWRNVIFHDLYYLNSSFNVNYKFAPKHKLKFGVGVANLVGARSNMISKSDKRVGLVIENNNWGVQDGLSQFDMMLSLGYEFKINREFAVQLSGNYGLFDRSNDEFFSDYRTFDNEMNVMIGLKYNLFRGIR